VVKAEEKKKDEKKIAEIEAKHVRIDGKKLTEKQKQELLQKVKDDEKKENPDFDPRKHKLKHGIRNYREPGEAVKVTGAFTGGGVKIGWLMTSF